MKNCNISYITQLAQAKIDVEDPILKTTLKEGSAAMDAITVQSEFLQVLQVLVLMSVSVTFLSALLWWLLPDRRRQCKIL